MWLIPGGAARDSASKALVGRFSWPNGAGFPWAESFWSGPAVGGVAAAELRKNVRTASSALSPRQAHGSRLAGQLDTLFERPSHHVPASCSQRATSKFYGTSIPTREVKIVEVGVRDGLQAESQIVPTEAKLQLLELLSNTGLKVIEATSFVNPKAVRQMADADHVAGWVKKAMEESDGKLSEVTYPVLVPNRKGFDKAAKSGIKEIAIFASSSEAFSQRNINCSIETSFERFKEFVPEALNEGMRVRGYLSCVMGCPYEGDVDPQKVASLAERLFELGCYEVSLGDTIGIGTAGSTQRLFDAFRQYSQTHPTAGISDFGKLAVHFHDTYGQALANILVALENGIAVVDSSVAGLGGCPFAEGARGNVATEDVLFMLQGLGIETGVDMERLLDASDFISSNVLGRKESASRAAQALMTRRKRMAATAPGAANKE